jgi:hypothetical protein
MDIGKPVFGEIPSHTPNQKVISQYIINENDKTVNVNYSIENMSQNEINANKQSFIEALTPTRDRYLYLTDFTQLNDAPISSESKK